jgi:hypothetical protein
VGRVASKTSKVAEFQIWDSVPPRKTYVAAKPYACSNVRVHCGEKNAFTTNHTKEAPGVLSCRVSSTLSVFVTTRSYPTFVVNRLAISWFGISLAFPLPREVSCCDVFNSDSWRHSRLH